jgi:hypothetical protein
MAAFPQTDSLGRYLRNRCYALASYEEAQQLAEDYLRENA